MQAGGRRFDPVNLHQDVFETSNLSRVRLLDRLRGDLGLVFLRSMAVMFFNNLEEVKIYQYVRQHVLMGVIVSIKKCIKEFSKGISAYS